MYTQKDIDQVNRQLRKRVLLWLVPEALILAALVYSFFPRLEWLSGLLLALLMAVLLASLSLSILPVRRYREFLRNAVHGRNRVETHTYDSAQEQPVMREGVRFFEMTFRADTVKEELDERTYYWDANLPLPGWEHGERVTLRSHEKMITGWERTGA